MWKRLPTEYLTSPINQTEKAPMRLQRNPQLNANGELIHLLSTEGLSKAVLTHILDTAANFVSVSDREVKKVPLLRGKSVFNLFFENSTRTRTTFDIAATRLQVKVRACSTPSTICPRWLPIFLWSAITSQAPPT